MVVTDDELTSSQARVLEKDSGCSVVDRTELIIKIFESHAKDSTSRLEVELADLEYRLPRIKGQNPAFSRLGGGVGGGRITRGPGEQQLEYDRRAIRNRIKSINHKLAASKRSRDTRNSRLKESGSFTVALVGYTNAGKTTILNSISGAGRSTADRLFETLETTTRRISGGSKPDFVVTDTVGFIRKLPTQLVHSFSSTLESARDHDVRVICADSSSSHLTEEIETVWQTLSIMGGSAGPGHVKNILCLNKADLLDDTARETLRHNHPEAVMTSALEDTTELTEAIYSVLSKESKRISIVLPYSEYSEIDTLYDKAEVHSHKDTENGALLDVTLPESLTERYAAYEASARSFR